MVLGNGKFDSEEQYGVFLGISGAEVVLSTATGIVRSRYGRRLPDAECWDRTLIAGCTVGFKAYLVPEATAEAPFDIPVIRPEHAAEIPQVDDGGSSRRMMLRPGRFPCAWLHSWVPGLHLSSDRPRVGEKTHRGVQGTHRSRVDQNARG